MCLCVCASVFLCVCVSVCLCLCVSASVCLCVCVFVCLCACLFVCKCESGCVSASASARLTLIYNRTVVRDHGRSVCRRYKCERMPSVNLPGWCWAEIQQFALVGSSSSLHSEACNALGASDGVIHSRIYQEAVCF